MDGEMTLNEQGELAVEFLRGLTEQFDFDADITTSPIDDDNLEVQVNGEDLGLLIGPRGQTLTAIQELTKTVLQRRATQGARGRVRVDVSGYRERRREALAEFTRKVAQEVIDSGESQALEPMNAADRKTVHDTINEIDGVDTISEGTDPRRRVVVVLAD